MNRQITDRRSTWTGNSIFSTYGREVVNRFARCCYSGLSGLSVGSELQYRSKHKEVYMFAAAYEQECFGNMLDYALERAGVAKNPAFDITEGRDGELRLATVHPCAGIIEELLNADSLLLETFRRIERYYVCITEIVQGKTPADSSFLIKVSNDGYRIRRR